MGKGHAELNNKKTSPHVDISPKIDEKALLVKALRGTYINSIDTTSITEEHAVIVTSEVELYQS